MNTLRLLFSSDIHFTHFRLRQAVSFHCCIVEDWTRIDDKRCFEAEIENFLFWEIFPLLLPPLAVTEQRESKLFSCCYYVYCISMEFFTAFKCWQIIVPNNCTQGWQRNASATRKSVLVTTLRQCSHSANFWLTKPYRVVTNIQVWVVPWFF